MRRGLLVTGLVSILAVFGVNEASAQNFGRVEITVFDAAGETVADVVVTVTCDDLRNFRLERKTNKKGKVSISLVDATRLYHFHLEHPEHGEIKQVIKPDLRSTKRVELAFTSGDQPAVVGDGQRAPRYSKAEVAFNEGVGALQNGDTEGAKAKFLEALELDSDLTIAHSALAKVSIGLEEWQDAIDYAERFMQTEGNAADSVALRVLYDAHKALGNKAEADSALKALSAGGSSTDAAAMLYNEGVASLRLGDDVSAEARLLEALVIDSNLAPAVKALAVIYGRRGDWGKTAAAAERFVALESDDSIVLRLLWEAYRGLGDSEKEAEARQALASVDPLPIAQDLFDRGADLFSAGRIDDAIAEIQAGLEFNPKHPRAHYQLGLCYLSQAKNADAIEHLEKFLELAPDDSEAESAREMLSYLE